MSPWLVHLDGSWFLVCWHVCETSICFAKLFNYNVIPNMPPQLTECLHQDHCIVGGIRSVLLLLMTIIGDHPDQFYIIIHRRHRGTLDPEFRASIHRQ